MTVYATEQDFQLPKIQGVIGDKRRYILLEDYCFEWEENGKRYRRTVFANPAVCRLNPGKDGCTTDLASVPDSGIAGAIAGTIGIDQAGPSDGGSVIHDDDYRRMSGTSLFKRKIPIGFPPGAFQILRNGVWIDCVEKYTRLRADKLYRRRCILGGMKPWKADLEFTSLRIGAVSLKNGLRWYFS